MPEFLPPLLRSLANEQLSVSPWSIQATGTTAVILAVAFAVRIARGNTDIRNTLAKAFSYVRSLFKTKKKP